MLKIKYIFVSCINWLIRLGGILEGLFLFFVGINLNKSKGAYYLLVSFLGLFLIYLSLKKIFKVYKSKRIIKNDAYSSRVTCFEGPPGRGKTSLMLYSASCLDTLVLSNVPFKINGDFVYKLDKSVLDLEKAIPEGSCACMDEVTLFYHNLDKINCYDFELLLQLHRHFFDGNFYLASVKASRLPQQIREKVSVCKYLIGQHTEYSSFFIGPILYFIFRKCLKIKSINIGFRIWTYQIFEDIDHPNYNFDLSNQTSNTITRSNHFAELVDIYAFNDSVTFEYNDRFMKYLYDRLDKSDLIKYDSLDFTEDSLNGSGYKKLIDYFNFKMK